MAPTPRPGILDIKPYVGGEAGAPGFESPARLASNENPLGPSPRAIEAYRVASDRLHRYPDGASHDLRTAIARRHNLNADQIVCGAGSDELITLLIHAYAGPGDEVLYSAHGFLMYALAALSAGATPVTAPERDLTTDVDALLERAGPRTRLVCIANPNNPTGSWIPGSELRRLADGLPEAAILLLDAAYAEYVMADGYEAGERLVESSDRVVMTRTFSKIHGLAALRLGWVYGPPAIAGVLNRVRGPFNVTAAAQAAGLAALDDEAHVAQSRGHNARWMDWFRGEAARLGLNARPSAGNFVLVQVPADLGAASLLESLKARGVLVRGMAAYGLPDSLRVTIGTEEEMRATVDALGEILS